MLSDYDSDSFFLKLQRCCPRTPSSPEDLKTWSKSTRLFFRIAALLPHHKVAGLGEEQRATILTTLKTFAVEARSALRSPTSQRTPLTPPVIELLRSASAGTPQRLAEHDYNPNLNSKRCNNPRSLIHKCASNEHLSAHANGLAQAELFYESLCAGLRRIESTCANPEMEEWDEFIPSVQTHISTLAAVFLFDSSRMQRGLEICAQTDPLCKQFISGGETNAERSRIGSSLQFIIASCICGCKDLGTDAPEGVLERANRLNREAHDLLHDCRTKIETTCYRPAHTIRLLLGLVSKLVDEAVKGEEASEMVLRMAFAYPCLHANVSNVSMGDDYDGGLLSVLDACLHLFKWNALRHKQALSYPCLLSAVLAGVTTSHLGHLGQQILFSIHCKSDVAYEMREIQAKWPTSAPPASPASSGPLRPCRTHGKLASANAALRGAMNSHFREERRSTAASEIVLACALTMLSVNHLLQEGGGVTKGGPNESVAELKKMYLSCFASNVFAYESSSSAVDSCWRDVVCGALLYKGPLYSFTKEALKQALANDIFKSGKFLPSTGSSIVFAHAYGNVRDVTHSILRRLDDEEGPVFVTRVCELLRVFSQCVYGNDSPVAWETLITRFCAPRGRKRSTVEEVEEVEEVETR